MTDGQCQSIGRIGGSGQIVQTENAPDHERDLLLVGAPGTGDRRLHLGRRVLVDGQSATAAGTFAGIVCGVALTVYYIVATRYFAIGFYETWSGLSNAGFGAVADFEAARDALAAATGEDQAAALAELDAAARRAANWFGIRSIGAGVLGAGAGTLVLLLVSAVTPRPGPSARLLVERMRMPSHGG